jgi:hypothetical protein
MSIVVGRPGEGDTVPFGAAVHGGAGVSGGVFFVEEHADGPVDDAGFRVPDDPDGPIGWFEDGRCGSRTTWPSRW